MDELRSRTFDWLALTYLHRRIHWLIIRLREQAIELAEQAAQQAPSQPAIVRLAPWLELYERGAVARALPYFVAHKKPLSAFIPLESRDIMSLKGTPDPAANLIISEIRRFRPRLPPEDFCTFKVDCVLLGEGAAHSILRCRGIPSDTANHLMTIIPKLTGSDLSPLGTSIAERLLNTFVLIPNRFLWLLSQGVDRIGPTFAQSVVLCSTQLPIKMDAPWRDGLNDRFPYTRPDPQEDTQFSQDVPRHCR